MGRSSTLSVHKNKLMVYVRTDRVRILDTQGLHSLYDIRVGEGMITARMSTQMVEMFLFYPHRIEVVRMLDFKGKGGDKDVGREYIESLI